MSTFQLLIWAVLPPLLLLAYYYRSVVAAPSILWVLLLFVSGGISGLVALGLEWVFEDLASRFSNWQAITYSLAGATLRQLVEVGPIEEGCKLATVVLFLSYRPQRRSTVFLFTIAAALGFTAEENWVYLANDTALIFERLISTPVHALFSAPWGYALGIVASSTLRAKHYSFLIRAWLTGVIYHASANVLSIAWGYPPPLNFLSYGFFPFLLWLWWRFQQLMRRSQGKPSLALLSSRKRIYAYGRRSLALLALFLGGNAIFGLFRLARRIPPLPRSQLLSPTMKWFICSRAGLNLIFGIIAWGIYRYLRLSARRHSR